MKEEKTNEMRRYYYIYFAWIKPDVSKIQLAQNSPTGRMLQGESMSIVDVHPLEFATDRSREGTLVMIKWWKELSKEEYDLGTKFQKTTLELQGGVQ